MKLHLGLLGALALLPLCGAAAETKHHWSYSGETGPSHWSALEPGYAACAKGDSQSPIDIQTAHVEQKALPPLHFNYKSSALHIVNNGHTIQVDVPAGSELTVGGDRYALVQFHFHHPSEETIDGKHYDMVVHLVHRDAKGHLAVVAVPLRSGKANELISTLWSNLPKAHGREATPHVAIDAAGLLPQSHAYFAYTGSLTTPPCSQGVRWFVLKSPMTVSAAQLATFSHLYPGNARSVQPLHGRVVLSSR
jgi:carbonic anhydrase